MNPEPLRIGGAEPAELTTQCDLRRIVANSLLALARKEISESELAAQCKRLNSQSRRRRLTVERGGSPTK